MRGGVMQCHEWPLAPAWAGTVVLSRSEGRATVDNLSPARFIKSAPSDMQGLKVSHSFRKHQTWQSHGLIQTMACRVVADGEYRRRMFIVNEA
ncbi:hypothetical protein BV22DRAFT_537148 [Leucogyrophana mollusca]|uniref:Uncharacterized protein n=1 Tax=Leucogyrophana mollusca TaxID=85980 RepID=A0ACB8BFK3_9AGAM|nr:hypothetical protein BV22DRAFT_537148 [Leucogyrophana mollusca]